MCGHCVGSDAKASSNCELVDGDAPVTANALSAARAPTSEASRSAVSGDRAVSSVTLLRLMGEGGARHSNVVNAGEEAASTASRASCAVLAVRAR